MGQRFSFIVIPLNGKLTTAGERKEPQTGIIGRISPAPMMFFIGPKIPKQTTPGRIRLGGIM